MEQCLQVCCPRSITPASAYRVDGPPQQNVDGQTMDRCGSHNTLPMAGAKPDVPLSAHPKGKPELSNAEEETSAAIEAERMRVLKLSPSELSRLGAKYIERDQLWEALETAIEREDATRLIRASWVMKNKGGGRFPRRGGDVPDEAYTPSPSSKRCTILRADRREPCKVTRWGTLPTQRTIATR